MNDLEQITDEIRRKVGHAVKLEQGGGELLSDDRSDPVWRVYPLEPFEVHEFMLWHLGCDRQWFESVGEAAAEYCNSWERWCNDQKIKTDYSADSIDYMP